MNVILSPEGILAQFDGYFQLKELDWSYYRNKYGNIHRLDRILKKEGKSPDNYQLTKQADTLMIFYLLGEESVRKILKNLQFDPPKNLLERNFDYYIQRTSHGSTLSQVVHAHLAIILGRRNLGWNMYQEALQSDYRDIQGGTTGEGIHTGVMAATLMSIIRCYLGVSFVEQGLQIQPSLPTAWNRVSCQFCWRGTTYKLRLSRAELRIQASQDSEITLQKKQYTLKANKEQILTVSQLES